MVVFRSTTIIIGLISNLFSYFCLDLELQPLYFEKNENTNNNNETKTNLNNIVSMPCPLPGPLFQLGLEGGTGMGGTWSSTFTSIFIYGTAAIHLHVFKAPGKGFTKISTAFGAFAIDMGGKFIENAINFPSYIRDQIKIWKVMWSKDKSGAESKGSVDTDVSSDTNLISEVNEINKTTELNNVATFLPSSSLTSGENNSEISTLFNELVNPIIQTLKPQQVDYSVELLMDQHHFIALCLFIMTISALFLFFVFLYNILLIIYKDKILNYFTNKYIVLYLKLQFKILNIETIVLALLIIYYFYFLIIGLQFLAIFPISVNI